jgi:hypothetical protein
MPVKRRVAKARAELSPGQELFLAGEPWPAPDGAYGYENDPGRRYMEEMAHCWLTSSWREDNPTGGPTARELWERYGAEVMASWPQNVPHPAVELWFAGRQAWR